jgi:hypothetical protein
MFTRKAEKRYNVRVVWADGSYQFYKNVECHLTVYGNCIIEDDSLTIYVGGGQFKMIEKREIKKDE